jgi:predicted ATPase
VSQGNCFQQGLASPYAPLLDLVRSSVTNQPLSMREAELQPFAQDRERRAQEFSLTRLTYSNVDAMLAAIFDLDPATRSELLNTLYPLTEGNPFFVEEVLTSLRAAGGIFYAERAWRSKRLEHLRIPRSIQAAVWQGRRLILTCVQSSKIEARDAGLNLGALNAS